jgi:hypothetical protein
VGESCQMCYRCLRLLTSGQMAGVRATQSIFTVAASRQRVDRARRDPVRGFHEGHFRVPFVAIHYHPLPHGSMVYEANRHGKDHSNSTYICFARTREGQDQRSEVRDQRSEIRDQRSEIRGQRSEVRDQRSEIRGQRSEVRDQRKTALTLALSRRARGRTRKPSP